MNEIIDVGVWESSCTDCEKDYEDQTAQFSSKYVYSECPLCKYIKEQEL
jgi:hypothetical protein